MKHYATMRIKHDAVLIGVGEALPDSLTDKQRQALIEAGAASTTKPAEAEPSPDAPAAVVVEAPKAKAGR